MDNLATTPPQPAKPRRSLRPWIIDLLLIYVLLMGLYFRFVGINWGEYQYLHPDERFLIWVGTDIQPVDNLGDYFDTANSTLNPHNRGHGFYVYGTLPMFLTRYIVEWIYGHSGFQEMTNVGRPLSALADGLAVFLVYLVAARTYGRKVGLLAAVFSALTVLQIQQSHFFTMDTFINLFTLLAVYFAVRVGTEERESKATHSESRPPGSLAADGAQELNSADVAVRPVSLRTGAARFVKHPYFYLSIAFGVALGCAVASKLNALPVAMMLPAAFGLQILKLPSQDRRRRLVGVFLYLLLAAIVSFFTFRIAQPYAFSGPGFFDIQPNPQWVQNILDQRNQAAGDVDFPPALQWARRPPWFSFQNMVIWGLGLPLGLLGWAGFLWIGWRILKGEWQRHALLWGWTAFYFTWQSLQFNPTMRYQLPVYPMLAIFAAWAVVSLYDWGRNRIPERRTAFTRPLAIGLGIFVVASTFTWAFMFSRVYARAITRVEASRWIYQNIPGPVNLLIQTEDDGVYNQPLPFPYQAEITPGMPYFTDFTAKASGTLSEVYLAHVNDGHYSTAPVEVNAAVSSLPDGEATLSTANLQITPTVDSSLPGSEPYTLVFSQPAQLNQDESYYLTFALTDESRSLDLCGDILLVSRTAVETFNQVLPPADGCTLQGSLPYSLPFIAAHSGGLEQAILTRVSEGDAPSSAHTLSLAIGPVGSNSLASSATFTTDPTQAGQDGRGSEVRLALDRPLELQEGQQYRLSLAVEAGEGAVTLQGARVANEGDWDDGLPLRLDGYDPFGGIYAPELNFNMYTDENPEKLERFLNIYDATDYILISSNRQWGVLPRLPERFPMSALHYRHLLGCPPERDLYWCYSVAEPGMFQGDFGFELVAVFQSDPGGGSFEVNDQFAEEAFTVYDHPKVLVFRKTESYDPEKVANLLGTVDFDQVIHVTPKKAESFPSNLMLPAARLAEQQAGGTWSELYNSAGFLNRFKPLGVAVWYLAVALVGWIAYPLARLALSGLPDRGYPLARAVGLLILSYLVWLAGSARLPFDRLVISLALVLMILVSIYLAYRQREELRLEWRQRKRYYLVVEGLFLAFFLFFLLVRLGNPDLWHPWKGGEKPMDFSYLNAVLKSTSFPPYDPWYAGGYLNYYYYGYVLVGALVKWLGLVPSFAYNLILPTLFGMVALGAFSLGWNLLYKHTTSRDPTPTEAPIDLPDENPPLPQAQKTDFFFNRQVFLIGLASAFLMTVLGNFGTVRMILRGYQMLGVPGGLTEETGFFARVVGTVRGLFEVLSGATMPYNLGDWYWIPSRVIPAPNDVEPITEFPYFTFLYADLHAHMIALPIALLALAWALSLILGRAWTNRDGVEGSRPFQIVSSFLLGGLAIGALRAINTWDLYTYLALGCLAMGFSLWVYLPVGATTFKGTLLEKLPVIVKRISLTVGGVLLLAGLTVLLYLPYIQWYGQGYDQVKLWEGSHTPISSYLTHWGLLLFLIVSWMVWETYDWMAHTPLTSLRKLDKYKFLIYLGLAMIILLLATLVWMKVRVAWLAVPLAAWAGVLILRPDLPAIKRAILFFVGTGLVLTLTVEVIVLVGDIGRMNTVFKFYLQVWTLFAISAAAAFGWLLSALKRWSLPWRAPWQVILVVLVGCTALYPILASVAKINDRIAPQAPHSLDGLVYMPYATYNESGTEMDLGQDYDAIRWMQENIKGSPVIVEANSPNLYRWYNRYTINTGLPGVLGWEWHQQQQRALNPSTWVHERLTEIQYFYTTLDSGFVRDFIQKYSVRYIVVGQLEQITFPGPGLEKFADFNGILWKEVYREGDTVIYEVLEEVLDG